MKSHINKYACDRYTHDKVTYLSRDVESLAQDPEYIGSFDFIYCSNVMEHIPDYNGALRAVKKLLSPNGLYLQVTPPSGKAKGNPYHVTNFTVPEWRDILKGYFSDQRYFAHIPAREREDTNNEFDFIFKECAPNEMGKLGSISGMILCQ
jgi:SAM-dependent methyltransferase